MDVRRLHYTPAICIALRRLNDPNKGRVMGLLRTILAKIHFQFSTSRSACFSFGHIRPTHGAALEL
jgi:hypothetical protein